MNYGDLKPSLDEISRHLRHIDNYFQDLKQRSSIIAGTDSVVPEGNRYVKITKTNGSGSVVITLPDTSTYTLTAQDEVFEIPNGDDVSINVSTSDGGTWKWYATK